MATHIQQCENVFVPTIAHALSTHGTACMYFNAVKILSDLIIRISFSAIQDNWQLENQAYTLSEQKVQELKVLSSANEVDLQRTSLVWKF